MNTKDLAHEEAYDLFQNIQRHPEYYAKQAASIRNERHKFLTYSKNAFVPLTYWCRNDCSYCQFRRITGEPFLAETEIQELLDRARMTNCSEILFTMGEKPEDRFQAARDWLALHGYSSTIDYLVHVCEMALESEFLPHSNPGVLSHSELSKLAEVNASMGLMVECVSRRLLLPGQAHEGSPTKDPNIRLRVIEDAGRLGIPFTTGLLIGIGESSDETVDGILAIRDLHEKFGHIQEVIIQNLVLPESNERTSILRSCPPEKLKSVVILARLLLNPEISIQVPPNLNRGIEEQLIALGVNDWGGISQVTIDHVNPQAPWPEYQHLNAISQNGGFQLVERLPVYPAFINSRWLRPKVLLIAEKFQQQLAAQFQEATDQKYQL